MLCNTGSTEMQCPVCPEISCKPDSSMTDGNGKILVDIKEGKLRSINNKTYFFGVRSTKADDAESVCCKLGMRLLAVESFDDIANLQKLHKDIFEGYNFFWTSGRLSSDCNDVVGWCSTGRTSPKNTVWKQQATSVYGDCAILKLYNDDVKKCGVDRSSCSSKNNYICEAPGLKHEMKDKVRARQGQKCTAPTCPAINCTKNNMYFEPPSYTRLNLSGELGRIQLVGNQTYFISKIKLRFKEALDACCAIDMRLVSIENRTKGNQLEDYLEINEQYWTGGSDLGCEGNFGWCGQGGQEFGRNIPWLYLEPNNAEGNEHCVNIDMIAWDSVKFTLNDNNCDKMMKFVCESKKPVLLGSVMTTVAPPVVVTLADCTRAMCPQHDCRESDPELMDDFVNVTFGEPKTACGRTMYLSKNRVSFADASKACHCSLKLKPITIETAEDQACIAEVIQKEYQKKNATVWTSASDDMCPGKYTWCGTNKLMTTDARWRKGEPSLNNWLQACVALHIGNNQTQLNGLADYKCSRKFRFICEVMKK
ncbi:uncharacterized protein LOC132205034 [Neocloeon triangulifer]|uniref:uncharacterized protein LOC132205034 n=1 Tax=Neocloeon triangulifer TaxID=2078957 RepID=UPI00286F313C|nr:uncharacterized protein LOC132205034 [Neocloeon triangulifer]